MPDLYAAGGIPAVQAELAKKGLLDLDVPTVTGKTLGENIKGAHIPVSYTHLLPTSASALRKSCTIWN